MGKQGAFSTGLYSISCDKPEWERIWKRNKNGVILPYSNEHNIDNQLYFNKLKKIFKIIFNLNFWRTPPFSTYSVTSLLP